MTEFLEYIVAGIIIGLGGVAYFHWTRKRYQNDFIVCKSCGEAVKKTNIEKHVKEYHGS